AWAHPVAQGDCQPPDATGGTWLSTLQGGIGGADSHPRLQSVCRTGESGGGEGSGRPTPTVARSARATRPGGTHAAVGNTHHRGNGVDAPAQSYRSSACLAIRSARTESTARRALDKRSDGAARDAGTQRRAGSGCFARGGANEQLRLANAARRVGATGLQGFLDEEGCLSVLHRRPVFFSRARGRPGTTRRSG